MTDTDYGVDLQEETTPGGGSFATIGEIVNLDIPSIVTNAIEKTNHASGGHRQFIPDGLISLDEFPITLNCTQTIVDSMYQNMRAKSVLLYKVVFPSGLGIADWSFGAFPTQIDIQEADAQSPGVMQIIITMRPTGEAAGIYI